MDSVRGFWGMTIRPLRTLGELTRVPAVLRKSVLSLTIDE